jgi:hypothetical protein
MKNLYKKFRDFNKRISMNIAIALFHDADDADVAYEKYPYMWLFILIPIGGFLGVLIPVWEVEFARQRAALDERKKRFSKNNL